MIIDGEKVPAFINVWANFALTGSELIRFNEAAERQFLALGTAIDSGIVTMTPLTVPVRDPVTNVNIMVNIGVSVSNYDLIDHDPEFLEFEAQWKADPNLEFPSYP